MTRPVGENAHHFEAEITILPLGPATRSTHPFNGIRWDFCYAEDLRADGSVYEVNMIWPEFVDASGNAIQAGIPLKGMYAARMHIVMADRVAYHRSRLTVGTHFFCVEGPRKVAKGVVTTLEPKR